MKFNKLEKKVSPLYEGQYDPRVLVGSIKAMFK
jgi:hypothetical protein